MPRKGAAARKRAREGKPPVKPGKQSWVHGTKLGFFTAYKEDFIAAAEIKETGAFYTRIAKLYLKKYGYNTAWGGDLEEGQDTADDVDEDEDVDTLLPEIAVWYHAQYGGNVRTKQVPKTFKQLFDRAELEPSEPTRKRELHYYSTNFYAERIKPRFITRLAAATRAAAERGEKPPAEVALRQQVMKEAWLAETPAFRAEISQTIDKLHAAALETYNAEEYSIALNNAAFYLTPFAEAAQQQFGMNVSILLCSPVPDRGGRIEVRSVHAGFSNGLVPRIWSDFDRGGFDAAQRSFVNFAHHCFTEEECRARALQAIPSASVSNSDVDVDAHGTPAHSPNPIPAAITASNTPTPTATATPHTPILTPTPTPMPNPTLPSSKASGTRVTGWTTCSRCGIRIWKMLGTQAQRWCMEYMEKLGTMTLEMLNLANERAEAQRRAERASNEAAAAAAARARDERDKAAAVATADAHGEAAPEGAGDEGDKAAAAATMRAHGEAAPEGAGDERDKAAAAATAGNEVGARGEAALEGAAAVEHTRPKPKPAWRGVQSGGVMALERPEASGEENEGQGNGEGGWKDYDKSGWPQELINAFRAFERGKTWGGAEWVSCVADFVALEQASGYPVKGDVLAPQGEKNLRPEEIPTFMQRRRKWEKGVTLTSGIGPASAQGSFADRWWAWWMRAQPAARVKANGKLGPADAIPMEEWVKFSKMAGKNGLLLYMGGLLWWGEAAAAATDSKMLLGDWRVAVLDMACALRVAVAAKDNGLDLNAEAENEAVAEPTTRTKRKKPEGVEDEEDKENEWPKYVNGPIGK
ncbi:hypothetical protein DFH08DRAFT_976752 [Mycena albidolilacea]|uniref:Uncharacterized protein n=1 Tax=Mycena albidolilacea TaxID=1033008 RepID=A0AAD7E9X9_9AGAR|nr:hypothetical protein DFH08DRAFT_976752 [Mycena albidolilacea]